MCATAVWASSFCPLRHKIFSRTSLRSLMGYPCLPSRSAGFPPFQRADSWLPYWTIAKAIGIHQLRLGRPIDIHDPDFPTIGKAVQVEQLGAIG
jgi:hypothetical protein